MEQLVTEPEAIAHSGSTPSRGVHPLNERARRIERRVTLTTVLIPYIGLAAGIILFWNRGVYAIDLAVFAFMYTVTVLGIGMGFHRLIAHRSFQAVPFLKTTLIILGSMAAQGPVIFWTAIHRRHHSYSDREGDPHSPHLYGKGSTAILHGLWHSHMGWLLARYAAAGDLADTSSPRIEIRQVADWTANQWAMPAPDRISDRNRRGSSPSIWNC